jgi:phage-related protein
MKRIRFVGSAKDDLSAFPKAVRGRAGQELFMVQIGRDPDDWKPLPVVGSGAREIRVRDEAGAFRVIYVARAPNTMKRAMRCHDFGSGLEESPAA